MSGIVFCKPPLPLEKLYGGLSKGGNEMPPLGLAYLAAATRQAGYETAIVDALPLKLTFEQTVDRILSHGPRWVGLTAVTISVHDAARVAAMLKQRDARLVTIIGGPHVTGAPEETMRRFPELDIGVLGEGERTVVDLLQALERGGALREVPGLILREDGGPVRTAKRAFIQDLDTLPYPAWDLLPHLSTHYQPAADSLARLPSTSLVTSRGCSGQCTFCDRGVFGNRCRAHSAEYVMGMIHHLRDTYGIRDIHIYEDNFTLFKPRLKAICDRLIEERADLSLFCMARVDTVTPEILSLMRRAGFWQIAWGIESGSQAILDGIRKDVTVEQNLRTLQWARDAGIRNQGYFMIGNFGETEASIKETLAFIRKAPLDDFHITFFTPLPGAPAYESVSAHGVLEKDWNELSEFKPNFVPNGLSAEILEKYHRTAYRQFYLRPRIVLYYMWKIIRNPRIAPKLLSGFTGFLSFIRKKERTPA
ncbi:MAG: cobalamin-dependent protein [Kiritimatiellae bacterium]|nr:cobalamin-dependent protein [Kiritimatiellia bacterium]